MENSIFLSEKRDVCEVRKKGGETFRKHMEFVRKNFPDVTVREITRWIRKMTHNEDSRFHHNLGTTTASLFKNAITFCWFSKLSPVFAHWNKRDQRETSKTRFFRRPCSATSSD
ncbi:unnamed protein product, partial [Nesidiocoris tenuis]